MQRTLSLLEVESSASVTNEAAQVVGLRCDDDVVTLRFMGDPTSWGQPARLIKLDRKVAEQLSRILNDELDDGYPRV